MTFALLMRVLFVTALESEADACRRAVVSAGADADVVFTGMGAQSTMDGLQKAEASSYDYVIDAGIAGSFTGAPLGAAFAVVDERNGEQPEHVFAAPSNLFHWLEPVSGLTFQTMTDDPQETARRKAMGCAVESMEGAAFFDWCQSHEVKNYAEIRTISNAVGESEMGDWDISLGLESLFRESRRFLEEYCGSNKNRESI